MTYDEWKAHEPYAYGETGEEEMKLSNLPPGVTNQMIEEAAMGTEELEAQEQRYREARAKQLCCPVAKPSDKYCVCVFVTECEEHGEKHYGGHE